MHGSPTHDTTARSTPALDRAAHGPLEAARLAFGTLLTAALLAGCITVPPAAVESSRLVGERIFELQASHEAFVTAYFDVSRQRIEDFMVYRWIPEFLDNFISPEVIEPIVNPMPFSDEQIERLRRELATAPGFGEEDFGALVAAVNRAFGDADRGNKILLIAEVANREIARQRRELLTPIDGLERRALAELRATYADAIALQRAVTGYLQSISDATTERDRILEQLELLGARDSVLAAVLGVNDEIEAVLGAGRTAEQILCALRNLLAVADEACDGEETPDEILNRLLENLEEDAAEPAAPEGR